MVIIAKDGFPSDTPYESHFETFPYPLSDFQKHAIRAIVDKNHCLVCAPTGSGKTLPAEFAINYFVSQGKRVIYTSPIKALSNQKYYEFTQKFPHISFGILTGDIKTNPEAQVLIVTTEILMNCLFRETGEKNGEGGGLQFQLDIEKDVGAVIFDEVHYINDPDRGQNWEQTILMLPKQIQLVMLSATIASPERFATWVENRYLGEDDNPTVVLATSPTRVVPLTHYSFLTTTESVFKKIKDKTIQKEIRDATNTLILLQNSKNQYQETGYTKIQKTLKHFDTNQLFMKRKHVLNQLAGYLKQQDMLPAIGFVFSRKHVEVCANEITTNLLKDDSKIPYMIRKETAQILRKLPNYQEYMELPEYIHLVALLEKGIAIHHSGMLPVLREIVEMTISKKYVKLLFATESFSIGLDCPIRTSFFVGLHKFDGNTHRFLHSHEYTQMAGRAGRRGIDTVGHVIHLSNLFPLPSPTEYKMMLNGKPQTLQSKFRISYSMVLNRLGCSSSSTQPDPVKNPIQSFVKQSMKYEETVASISQQTEVVNQWKTKIESKEAMMNQVLQTPREICIQYLNLEKQRPMVVNKKRKEVERQISTLENEYYNIGKDGKMVAEYLELLDEWKFAQSHLDEMTQLLDTQSKRVCHILQQEGFVKEDGGEYQVTLLGKVATQIAEIPGVLVANQLMKMAGAGTGTGAETPGVPTPKQLVGFFSIFTDLKVPEENKTYTTTTPDTWVKQQIDDIISQYIRYESLEHTMGLDTGIPKKEDLNFDFVDCMMEWCDCSNEQETKYFIQRLCNEKNISIGDFSKAVLKISTIGKEWASVAEQQLNHLELYHTITQIDGMILKYITTNQSLYI